MQETRWLTIVAGRKKSTWSWPPYPHLSRQLVRAESLAVSCVGVVGEVERRHVLARSLWQEPPAEKRGADCIAGCGDIERRAIATERNQFTAQRRAHCPCALPAHIVDIARQHTTL